MKPKQFRFDKNEPFTTSLEDPLKRKEANEHLEESIEAFSDLQEKLYADNHHSLLLVFQGMDAAGKDSTIANVTSGVNPSGFQVFNFKQPNDTEMDHNFLWRAWNAMPERGRIGIFNRSYYEEVLVVKVHPEIVEKRRLPNKKVNKTFWKQRYQDINAMETHLFNNGTRVIKFFLNVSKDEQRKRFLSRLDRPEKNWKFSSADLRERGYWDDYQVAFREAIAATDSDKAPWYIIPADDKRTMRAIVASIIVSELKALELEFPKPQKEEVARFDAARASLLAE